MHIKLSLLKTVLFSLLYLMAGVGMAQSFEKADSLREVITNSESSKDDVYHAMLAMAKLHNKTHLDSTLKYSRLLLNEIDFSYNALMYLETISQLGLSHEFASNFDSAIFHFNRALMIADSANIRKPKLICYINIANCHEMMGENVQAISILRKANAIADTIEDGRQIFTIWHALGNLLQGYDLELSKAYHLKSLKKARTLQNPGLELYAQISLSENAFFMNDLQKSIEYGMEGMKISRVVNSLGGQAVAGSFLGEAYLKLEKLDSAAHYFNTALDLASKYEISYVKWSLLLGKGRLELAKENPKLALQYCQEALVIAKKGQFKGSVEDCESCIGESYFNLGNYKAAYQHKSLYFEKEIENLDVQKVRSVTIGQMKLEAFQDSVQTAQAIQTEQRDRIQAEKQTRQTLVWASILGVFALFFILFVIRRYRIEREQKQIIQYQQDLLHKDYLNLKEFTENASHEMQTPVAIIQSNLERLFQIKNLNPKEVAYIESAVVATVRMGTLNRSLLLLSKIDNNQFPLTDTVNVMLTIEKFIEGFTDFIEAKEIQILREMSPKTISKANQFLTETLVSNLFSNAIKHNLEGGSLRIILNDTSLIVENTGLPLSEDPSLFFERFKKGAQDHSNSTGLGLSIAKKCCEAQNWTINYEQNGDLHTLKIDF